MSRFADRTLSHRHVVTAAPTAAETAFAIACRSLRRERGLLMKDQARAFGCSIAYVSAVETGKKGAVPEGFVEQLIAWLKLDDLTTERLRRAADETATTVTVRSAIPAQARLLAVLGRSLEQLTGSDIEDLRVRVLAMRQRALSRDKDDRIK